MEKKDRENLFLDKEFIEFYKGYKHEKDNLIRMLDGNVCRICVCEDEDELFRQFYNGTKKLQELLILQLKKFRKIEELGYK